MKEEMINLSGVIEYKELEDKVEMCIRKQIRYDFDVLKRVNGFKYTLGSCSNIEYEHNHWGESVLFLKGHRDSSIRNAKLDIRKDDWVIYKEMLIEQGFEVIDADNPIERTAIPDDIDCEIKVKFEYALEEPTEDEVSKMIAQVDLNTFTSIIKARMREEGADGEDLTPDKLYTVEKLTDYAIYENRFVKTLVDRLYIFISNRYNVIKENVESFNKNHLNIKSDFGINNTEVSLNVDVVVKKSILDKDAQRNAELLKRVDYLNKMALSFKNSPLYREIHNAPKVNPPIMKTNIIMKNVDFNGCYMLWLFLDKYNALSNQDIDKSIFENKDNEEKQNDSIKKINNETNSPIIKKGDGSSLSKSRQFEAQIEAQRFLMQIKPLWKFPPHYGEYNEERKPYYYSTVEVKDNDANSILIVLKSYKKEDEPFKINPEEWKAMIKNSAKLLIYTGSDIKRITKEDLIRNQSSISLSFSTENLDIEERISAFCLLLNYFKDLHFDFDSFNLSENAESIVNIYKINEGVQNNNNTEEDI